MTKIYKYRFEILFLFLIRFCNGCSKKKISRLAPGYKFFIWRTWYFQETIMLIYCLIHLFRFTLEKEWLEKSSKDGFWRNPRFSRYPPPFRVLFAKLGKIYYLKGEIDELLREKYNKKEWKKLPVNVQFIIPLPRNHQKSFFSTPPLVILNYIHPCLFTCMDGSFTKVRSSIVSWCQSFLL